MIERAPCGRIDSSMFKAEYRIPIAATYKAIACSDKALAALAGTSAIDSFPRATYVSTMKLTLPIGRYATAAAPLPTCLSASKASRLPRKKITY